jgi:hypothetical protein
MADAVGGGKMSERRSRCYVGILKVTASVIDDEGLTADGGQARTLTLIGGGGKSRGSSESCRP